MNAKLILRPLFCLFLSLCTVFVNAQLVMPGIFSDNMVLQRGKTVPVWGKASPGELVAVSFGNQHKSVKAGLDSSWRIELLNLKASAIPAELIIRASNSLTFKNVLVGDVWLCSGQSNMEYPLDRKIKKYAAPKRGTDKVEEELPKSKPDAIRYIYVERTLNKIPVLPTRGWTGGNDSLVRYASAIGYFFAKEIYEKTKIPIGIISSSWGGTRIEQWMPEWSWKNSAIFKDSVNGSNFKIDGMHPGQMYKGLIEPLVPYAVKGVLWYQGESNCMIEDQATYPDKFELFVNTWREFFRDSKLPFYYVQIAPYLYTARKDQKKHNSALLARFWEAQAKSLSINNTGMVVTTDLVDTLSDIHPSYKWEVGHRLALVAMAKSYGQAGLEYSGPVFKSAKIMKSAIRIQFSHIGTGLASMDGKALNWFSIAGEDGVFMPAEAVVDGKEVIVSAANIANPKFVRLGWDESARPNLINKEGLPAAPFRTDQIKTD